MKTIWEMDRLGILEAFLPEYENAKYLPSNFKGTRSHKSAFAPASRSERAFRFATSPLPITRHRLFFKLRKAGKYMPVL